MTRHAMIDRRAMLAGSLGIPLAGTTRDGDMPGPGRVLVEADLIYEQILHTVARSSSQYEPRECVELAQLFDHLISNAIMIGEQWFLSAERIDAALWYAWTVTARPGKSSPDWVGGDGGQPIRGRRWLGWVLKRVLGDIPPAWWSVTMSYCKVARGGNEQWKLVPVGKDAMRDPVPVKAVARQGRRGACQVRFLSLWGRELREGELGVVVKTDGHFHDVTERNLQYWQRGDRIILALSSGGPLPFRLCCVDALDHHMCWQREVWGTGIPMWSGPRDHSVDIAVKDGILYVFGCGGGGAYVESFELLTGMPLFRVSSTGWYVSKKYL